MDQGKEEDPTPFDQRLFLIFIVTFAVMTAFEFLGQYLYPYTPDWRSNLVTSFFTSGLAVAIAYYTLSPYYRAATQLSLEIQQRHTIEMELREREERLRRTFDQSPVGAAILSVDLQVVNVNNALCAITGYTPNELLSHSILSIFVQNERERVIETTNALKNGSTVVDERDLQLVQKTGDLIWVRQSIRLLRDSNGGPLFFIPMFVDIHDRKLAEEALQKTNKKLAMLSTTTRHDIKNQLTGLAILLQLVKNEAPNDPVLQGHINRMEDCSNAIERQIEFTRYYEDLGTLNAGWFEIYQGVLEEARQLSLEGISLDPGKKGVSIYADQLIGKVYYNLMENSLRHGGKVTRISFREEETENGLLIRYTDDGTGIPMTEKEKIFLRGYGRNTGLGLFLIREILATTGISITETGSPGQGACFEIRVPKGQYKFSALT